MSVYIQLLRNNPGFARLWSAQVVSLLGDWFNMVVLSSLVARYAGENAGIAVSGFLLARMLPPLIVSPIAGVLADRFNRKHLLIVSDVLRAVVVLLLIPASGGAETLWLIYVLTVVQFILSAAFEPGRNAIMPSLLQREDLVVANTLSSVTWSVMLAVGGVVGGGVGALFGKDVALFIDALTFLLSAMLIIPIKVRSVPIVQSSKSESDRSFMEGLRYLAKRPGVIAAILVKPGISIGSVDAVVITYGTVLFAMGENGTLSLAILWSAFGVGAIIGPLLLNRFTDGTAHSLRRMIVIGFVWVTAGWFFFGLSSTLAIAAVALVVRAMGGSVNWTYSSVIIQKTVDDEFLGRMFSLDMGGFHLMATISIITVGVFTQMVGDENIRQVVIGTGIVSIIPLILWTLMVAWLGRRKNSS